MDFAFQDAMKNVTIKKLEIESGESDLEEGEILEFDVTQATIQKNQITGTSKTIPYTEPIYEEHSLLNKTKSASHVKKPQNFHGSYIRNIPNYSMREGRYGSLPQGYCIPQESKFISGSNILQADIYDNKINDRRTKYLHPYQATYGSVEDIMTKIGETLGKTSNYYCYKERSKGARRLLNLNSSRKIDAIHREFNPVSKKSTHHKRRRRQESESDSDCEIWDKKAKNKSKNCLSSKRKEKNFKKKIKREYTEIVLSDVNDIELTCEKNNCDETAHKIAKYPKTDLSTRLFKEIPLPQEKEVETVKVDGTEIADDSDSRSLVNKDSDKNEIDSPEVVVNSDECATNTNMSDHEDKDDDLELIKLRLLALTSNKKKCQILTDDSVNNSKNLNEKADESLESNLIFEDVNVYNESQEDCSISNEKKISNGPTDDIDRHELLLRAEALKTALLKKHKHRIKKLKMTPSDVAQKDNSTECSEGNFVSGKKEPTNGSSQENGDKNAGLPVTSPQNTLDSKIEPDSQNRGFSFSPSREVEFQKIYDLKSSSRENHLLRKKTKKRKYRASRKSESLNVPNNGFSDTFEEEEDAEKIKLQLLFDLYKKRTMKDQEKKSNLPSALKAPSDSAVKCKQTLEPNFVSAIEKPTSLVNETTKVPTTEIERIIVHLGSDSSDEECASQGPDLRNETENIIPETSLTDYDKSVELLLCEARRRIEMKSEESLNVPSTPEAVYSHLPPSQRLEYIRLKQKIAETEKLKKMKEAESDTTSCQGGKTDPAVTKCDNRAYVRTAGLKSCSMQKPVRNATLSDKPASGIKNRLVKKDFRTNSKKLTVNNFQSVRYASNNKEVSSKLISEVKPKKEVAKNNLGSKNGIAVNSVNIEKSILERKKILTQNRLHLERLKILWKKLKFEKMIKEKYMNEVKRLKAQQNIFELKINQQRLKINKLAEESKQIYEAFQKNNKVVEVINKKKAPDKDKTTSIADLEKNDGTNVNLGEGVTVGADTSELCLNEKNLKTSNGLEGQKESEKNAKMDEHPNAQCHTDELKEYNSPLQSLSVGSKSEDGSKLDPNAIICQYDLLGKCNDEECGYQHLRT